MFSKIETYIALLDTDTISAERKTVLQPLIDYIQTKVNNQSAIQLNFICTHNSRRSHFTQIWAQTLASTFGINHLTCYSGGTETTALFPMVVDTLKNTGFEIEKLAEATNSIYSIKFADNAHPIIGFSKIMDDQFNPSSTFAAIMTCSQADEGCPFVPGTEKRIPITYEDPKVSDGTDQQVEVYEERSKQIATEMKYIFSQIKNK